MDRRVVSPCRTRAFSSSHGGFAPWWIWVLLAGGMAAATPTWGQSPETLPVQDVPEVVKPAMTPRSGVIVPPADVSGGAGVIRPPADGLTPVIPPPGSPGGNRSVTPK